MCFLSVHQHSARFLLLSNSLAPVRQGQMWFFMITRLFQFPVLVFTFYGKMPVWVSPYTHEVEIYQSLCFSRSKPRVTIKVFFLLRIKQTTKSRVHKDWNTYTLGQIPVCYCGHNSSEFLFSFQNVSRRYNRSYYKDVLLKNTQKCNLCYKFYYSYNKWL